MHDHDHAQLGQGGWTSTAPAYSTDGGGLHSVRSQVAAHFALFTQMADTVRFLQPIPNCATPSPSLASKVRQDAGPSLAGILDTYRSDSGHDMQNSVRAVRGSSGWEIGSRRTPSFRHHQGSKTGPDVLLPLLPEVSSFTWSGVRAQHTSAESVGAEDRDGADEYSHPAASNAATSHLNLLDGLIHHSPDRVSVLGGPGGSAATRGSGNVSPSGKRSWLPSALSSKAPSPRDPDESLETLGSNTVHTNPIPRAPLPPSESSHATPSKAKFHSPAIFMEPVWEQGAVNADSGSRPASLQLPSPPASPPVPPQSRSSSHARSAAHVPPHSHSRSQSQASVQQADWRFNAHRTRPPPASAPARAPSLPFRPASSSATTPSWSPPVATNLNLPHSPPRSPPASHASSSPPSRGFRSSLYRSGPDSTVAASDITRYPSVAASTSPPIPETETWSPSARRRSGSVMSERPARPHGARPKPVEMLRQESSASDVRSGRRASMSAVPLSGLSMPVAGISSGEHGSRAHQRSSVSLVTPQTDDARTPHEQRAALSYADSQLLQQQQSRTAQPGPSSSHTTSRTAPSRADIARSPEVAAELAAYSLTPSRRSSVSHTLAPSSSAHSQPALVRKKDSAALKPIPVSALLHSPPRGMHSREGSLSIPALSSGSRSRSGSVVSIPPSREGSMYEGRMGRRESLRPVLPPFEQLPPMEFAKHGDYDDDE